MSERRENADMKPEWKPQEDQRGAEDQTAAESQARFFWNKESLEKPSLTHDPPLHIPYRKNYKPFAPHALPESNTQPHPPSLFPS